MATHKQLAVWQESRELVEEMYKISHTIPSSEQYGLTSQIRRAAISIPVNIAEEAACNSDKEFTRFLCISPGSLSELETLLIIASRLSYVKEIDFSKIVSIRKKMIRLIKYFKNLPATRLTHKLINS